MIRRMKKGLDVQLSNHVKSYEIECQCADPRCKALFYDTELLERFESLRLVWSEPIQIISGHRCCIHNTQVEGSSDISTHMVGMALDLYIPSTIDIYWFKHEADELFEFTYLHEYSRTIHCDIMIRD